MAHAALVSLKNTIDYTFHVSPSSALPIALKTKQHIPEKEIGVLENVIDELDRRIMSKSVKALEEQIRRTLHGLEDVIDFVFADPSTRDEAEEVIRQGINSFVETVKKISEEFNNKLECQTLSQEEEEEEEAAGGEGEGGGVERCKKLVGFSNELKKLKDELIEANKEYELRVVSFVGVAGTYRSVYAHAHFSIPDADRIFKVRAWVSVGPKYQLKQILASILSQIEDTSGNDHELLVSDEEKIYTCLSGRRYLIVLDDLQEIEVWSYLQRLFPDDNHGSRVLVITHLEEVALFAKISAQTNPC